MRPHVTLAAATVIASLLLLAACGGGQDDASTTSAPETTGPSPTAPASPPASDGADPIEPPGSGSVGAPEDFVGLSFEDAVALAEKQERPWRVGREDGERFALTQDYVVGRVTFELDGGFVILALIEGEGASGGETERPPSGAEDSSLPGDPGTAQLLGAAVTRIVKVDNSFGGGDPFERVEIATTIGDDAGAELTPLDRELIAAGIEDAATVEFIPSAGEAIDRYFERNVAVAVVSIDGLRINGDRAEIDMGLWCGSLCGTWFTYEAERVGETWRILGTTGPIAVS